MATRVLVIDNYDSFVYNLVQYLGELGAEPVVLRNDAFDVADVEKMDVHGILVSPGPGRPEHAGVSMAVIDHFKQRLAVLGVCLGHQCVAAVFGGVVERVPVMHGKASVVTHDGEAIYAGVAQPLSAARYHSLAVDPRSVPAELMVSAWAEDGTVMGLRHRELPIEGVQFHPESVLTGQGHQLVANWLRSLPAR